MDTSFDIAELFNVDVYRIGEMALEDQLNARVFFDKLSRAIKTKENFMSLFHYELECYIMYYNARKYQDDFILMVMVDGFDVAFLF